MSSNLVKTSLYLKKEDAAFLNENSISLTKFVRNTINKIKESEGQDIESQPTDEPHERSSNV